MPVELQDLWHLLQIILLQHVLLAHTCIKKRNMFTNSSIIKKKMVKFIQEKYGYVMKPISQYKRDT